MAAPNMIEDGHRDWWAFHVHTEDRITWREASGDGDPQFRDPRVVLVADHPLVGRVARWHAMSNEWSLVRRVIRVDGTDVELLLHDGIGYPWIRVPMGAELRPPKVP